MRVAIYQGVLDPASLKERVRIAKTPTPEAKSSCHGYFAKPFLHVRLELALFVIV